MLGLTLDKILVLGFLAAFVIGPTRLPDAAAQIGRFVRMVRRSLDGAKSTLRDTGGPDLDEIDWKKLDPRQYDPRRLIRDALLDGSQEVAPPPAPSRPAARAATPVEPEISLPLVPTSTPLNAEATLPENGRSGSGLTPPAE